LKERIQDKAFIDLMYKALKAGYKIEGNFFKEIGTPQGSVMSPILANVVLHKLDMFITKLKSEFDLGDRHRINPEYKQL
jgi:retron-type reverse transcriptase